MTRFGLWFVCLALMLTGAVGLAQQVPSTPHRGKVGEDLAAIDAKIAATRNRTLVEKPSWLDYEVIASLAMTRARLTGMMADYQVAEMALVDAFRVAPAGSGPFMTRAKLHLTLHRLDAALSDIERAEKGLLLDNAKRAELAAMRSDILFQRGDLKQAESEYKAALALEKTTSTLIRLAQIAWKRGNFKSAQKQLDNALRFAKTDGASPLVIAYLHVHRGILELDRGRVESALPHFLVATETYPGWYLAEEHVAECWALLGKEEDALRSYSDIVARVPAGEFMDALADTLEKRDPDQAKQWRDKARQAYSADLEVFPEASFGHALDHYLAAPGQQSKAVELAEKNAELRGGGEALTKLAQAYVRAKRMDDAEKTADRMLALDFRTAELLGTAAVVYRLVPQKKTKAIKLEKAAQKLNPTILEDLQWLTQD